MYLKSTPRGMAATQVHVNTDSNLVILKQGGRFITLSMPEYEEVKTYVQEHSHA